MRIAVMAAGALGGYFGARLAAAGHEVFFIARGPNLEAIKKDGLKVESVHGNLHLSKPNATDDPAEVGPVDTVLFAVKLWDSEKAVVQAFPLLGPHTRVISLQNGVDSVGANRPYPRHGQCDRWECLYCYSAVRTWRCHPYKPVRAYRLWADRR